MIALDQRYRSTDRHQKTISGHGRTAEAFHNITYLVVVTVIAFLRIGKCLYKSVVRHTVSCRYYTYVPSMVARDARLVRKSCLGCVVGSPPVLSYTAVSRLGCFAYLTLRFPPAYAACRIQPNPHARHAGHRFRVGTDQLGADSVPLRK